MINQPRRRRWGWSAIGIVAVAGLSTTTFGSAGATTEPPAEPATTASGDDTAATSDAPAAEASGELLWVQPLLGNPVHRIMQGGFLSQCDELGYDCTIVGSEEVDVPATNALAEAALATGDVRGVAVYAFDPSTYPFIEQVADDYELPVVSWHIPVPEGDAPGLLAIAGGDPVAYATETAEAMGEEMGGTGTVAVTQGSFNTTENLVAETFTATMNSMYPDIVVLEPQEEGFDLPKAVAAAVAILQSDPDVTAAFSTTGGGPQTWAGAQEQTDRDLVIVGMDYVRQNLDLVESGEVFAVVGQPLFEEGAAMADLLDRLIRGETVAYDNPIPAVLVTQDNVDEYYALLDEAEAAVD